LEQLVDQVLDQRQLDAAPRAALQQLNQQLQSRLQAAVVLKLQDEVDEHWEQRNA